jgi:putative acyl-CoA dehydrogenase
MALDVLRVLKRGPALFETVISDIGSQLGPTGRGTVDVLNAALKVAAADEGSARILTEQLALAAAAAELKRLGAGQIADAFIESRLAGQWRTTYGMLDARHDSRAIVDTLYPEI